MNFRFQNLLCAPYLGGNAVVLESSTLLSVIGNRIAATDLVKSQTVTLPFEASTNLYRLDASPDGHFLIAVDDAGRIYYVNLRRRVLF